MKGVDTNILVRFLTGSAKLQGCESVITFDKKAAKSDLFQLVK